MAGELRPRTEEERAADLGRLDRVAYDVLDQFGLSAWSVARAVAVAADEAIEIAVERARFNNDDLVEGGG